MDESGRIVVFDMHGIVFSFSEEGDVFESSEILDGKVREMNYKYAKFYDVFENEKSYLKAENLIVKKIVEKKSDIDVYFMEGAYDKLISCYEGGDKIVIVSTSEVETSRMILEYLFNREGYKGVGQMLYTFDIYNSLEFGSKKQKKMWMEVLKNYDKIDELYEDVEMNLEAAKLACLEFGFEDVKFFNIIDLEK